MVAEICTEETMYLDVITRRVIWSSDRVESEQLHCTSATFVACKEQYSLSTTGWVYSGQTTTGILCGLQTWYSYSVN